MITVYGLESRTDIPLNAIHFVEVSSCRVWRKGKFEISTNGRLAYLNNITMPRMITILSFFHESNIQQLQFLQEILQEGGDCTISFEMELE